MVLPRTSVDSPGWLATVRQAIEITGVAVVEGVLDPSFRERGRECLYATREAIHRQVGVERLEHAGERGVLRIPMVQDPWFYGLLELPPVLAVIDALLSPTAILHLQNGFILPSEPAGAERVFQTSFHMDFRRVLNGCRCSVNTLFAVDEFTSENGGTLVVPGSHQKTTAPDRVYLETQALAVECPAGSMLVFDSTLWHAAGRNRSGHDRLAVNQQFTHSYFKQQIDYVRALGDDNVLALHPRTQQLLGWYTRVVSSLDEYYRPPEERLYRACQG